jgi:hypothetical protein
MQANAPRLAFGRRQSSASIPFGSRETRIFVPKPLEDAILAAKRPSIRRMSDQSRS